MYTEEFQQLMPRVDELQGLLPVKRVEIERKDMDGKVTIMVRVIGAGFSFESTSCTQQFVVGILSAFPFKILSNRVFEGMIEITAVEEKKPER